MFERDSFSKSNMDWRRLYLGAASFLALLDAIFVSVKNPYGDRFLTFAAPSLVLIIALLWSLAAIAPILRFVGMLACLALGVCMMWFHGRQTFGSFAPTIVLVLCGHAVLLSFLTPRPADRSTIVVTHSAVLFIILLGLYIRFKGLATLLGVATAPTAPAFLFWAPLGVAILWAGAVAFDRDRTGQIVLVCGIIQIGIGFFDLSSLGIRWAIPAGMFAWICALGVAGWLAARWDSSESEKRRAIRN
jgi:hypothetical protein